MKTQCTSGKVPDCCFEMFGWLTVSGFLISDKEILKNFSERILNNLNKKRLNVTTFKKPDVISWNTAIPMIVRFSHNNRIKKRGIVQPTVRLIKNKILSLAFGIQRLSALTQLFVRISLLYLSQISTREDLCTISLLFDSKQNRFASYDKANF